MLKLVSEFEKELVVITNNLESVLYLLYKSFGISPLVALATIFNYKPAIEEFKKLKKVEY
jgi:hypothetical protein